MTKKILLIDDDSDLSASLAQYLKAKGFLIFTAPNGTDALRLIDQESFDAVILDWLLEGLTGEQILASLRERDSLLPVLILTGSADINHAVTAVKTGASDYITKPVRHEELLLRLEKTLQECSLKYQVQSLQAEIKSRRSQELFIAESPGIEQLLEQIRAVAATEMTLLLQGESGTGKELLARRLHDESPRSQGPFIAVDCGAIPETLLEAELFGYERGAFTDARSRKQGLFELASNGTLFLDEIANLPLNMQPKLLRVIENKTLRRLGAGKDTPFNARLVAATNKNLREAVNQGAFREDLFFRLNQFPVTILPLRQRPEDIEPLARHFLNESSRELKKSCALTAAALETLKCYSWPGNVRELKNVISRAGLLCHHDILPEHLLLPSPSAAQTPPVAAGQLRTSRQAHERQVILDALKTTSGNKRRAANLLGIHRSVLYYKLKILNISLTK